MQKICAIILLSALLSNFEALPQNKWSKPIRTSQGQLVRERRQFPFGDWIPLTQTCPTCRPFADPLDVGLRGESIGLTPPRPPTVTRQVHGEGNFFPQDESSILSVPPPPPSAIPRQPVTTNGNFRNLQFSGFSQFNSPLPVPTQQIFPQTQQIQFLPQSFLPNQQVLTNVNNPNTIFTQGNQGKGQINDGKVNKFTSEFKTQKLPENVVLEQNRPVQPTVASFTSKPKPFSLPQQQGQGFGVQGQQAFSVQGQGFGVQQQGQGFGVQQQGQGFGVQQQGQGFGVQQQGQGFGVQKQGQQIIGVQQQGSQGFTVQQQRGQGFSHQGQQSLNGQQQQSVNFRDSILTPPPAPINASQDIVIPGLDKEEIQLLYVPVETLRQRGNFQQQLLTQQQQSQNIQFNRPSPSQGPTVSVRPTDQSTTKIPLKGHFVTQNGNSQGHSQSLSTVRTTSAQQFPTTVTPSSIVLQQLPFSQTPQPFVSATPASPTVQSFVTPSSVSQKFSSFTPETTLPHLVTIPNTVQFSQPDVQFGTTPKSVFSQGDFQEQISNGKSQFNNFNVQQQPRPLQAQKQEVQTLTTQHQAGERHPQQNFLLVEEKQKELDIQNQIPNQQIIEQEQISFQKQEQQRLLQQQKEKEAQEQLLLKQRQQKELEAQHLLQQQKQKELEEQKFLQLQKQKELEQQRFLQQQRQKELEEQRFLQQQRQKELEQQRYLQQQREKELENQRRLQLQREKELEEKRRLQEIKQREEERLLRIQQQQQQRELEEQRLLKQQQEEQQRLLLQKQKQENYKKQQQIPFYQQQQQQQPQQQFNQQAFQQTNRHTLPVNDKLNSISQLEKESEPETNQQLVPHQPPLSVFYKGHEGGNARIVDVLRELRSSSTITVLDQYFEKMPKVFVGPAGLIPPAGYGKFDLPYLSNIESNRIERKIDRLPFFVAPLNFIPPPGYAKIPFPAPHVGSVVVSSESNPAMNEKQTESEQTSGSIEEAGSFPMVGPELPGLINGLEIETTTAKPTFPSTPSLPQTTAQLRNRRPNSNLYRTQSRKPISKTRVSTTSRPEEEVTQPIPKTEAPKEAEGGIRRPFNRFLNRRRQQTKTTTETPVKTQYDSKNLENKQYSVEVYHQQKNTNQQPRQPHKTNLFQSQKIGGQPEVDFGTIDRSTPGGHGVFGVSPTPDFHNVQYNGKAVESEGHGSVEYSDANLQTFEDGPLPTGSAKTITHELYRPNAIPQQQRGSEISSKFYPKPDSTLSSEQFHHSSEEQKSTKISEISDANPTVGFFSSTGYTGAVSKEVGNIQPTPNTGFDKQDVPEATSEKFYATESPRTENPFTPSSLNVSPHQPIKGFGGADEYTQAFAEISKHHHIPSPTEASRGEVSKFSNAQPTPEISLNLQAPVSKEYSQEQNSQEFLAPGDVRPTQNSQFYNGQFLSTGTSNEQYSTGFSGVTNGQQAYSGIPRNPVSSVAPVTTQETYAVNSNFQSQSNSQDTASNSEERRPSFISFHNIQSTPESSVNFQSSSAVPPTQEYFPVTPTSIIQESKGLEETYASATPETAAGVSVNPSTQNYNTESASENISQINDQKQATEGHGQNFDDNLSNGHRLKLTNPSIVRVRTRVRGKPRGQINFAASQTTTLSPDLRPKVEIKHNGNPEEDTAKVRDYQPIKTSKYNQYRGLKKPVRTTTEATTESEQKPSVYTIRPPRRNLNPSTVSTKRIRRPTTPISTVETATEGFGISTPGHYSHSENSGFSPSGVSNDVYYEHTSFSPVRQKFRKHFGSAEPKSDVVPSYVSTESPISTQSYLSTAQSYLSTAEEEYVQPEANHGEELTQTVSETQEHSDRYPEWNPSESGIDVSGIVLTTIRTNSQEEQADFEEPKKTVDSKKAFDPDLDKKSGRRRVRVRVHKRPHENFETAESQNLRTVANVLVPPTSTYKPNDETNFHQLAKNSDFSFGGQKSFGVRSREYFRKRLNLTDTDNVDQKEHSGSSSISGDRPKVTKVLGYVRKTEKGQKSENDTESTVASENNTEGEGNKVLRTKHRGYIRKVIKHKTSVKNLDSELNQSSENEDVEEKHEQNKAYSKFNHEGLNHGKLNGTRHRTFVRYVKKNKIRPHETESPSEATSEAHIEEEVNQNEEISQNVTETFAKTAEPQPVQETESITSELTASQNAKDVEVSPYPVYQSTEEAKAQQVENSETAQIQTSEAVETKEQETNEKVEETEKPEIKEITQLPTTEEPGPGQIFRNLFQPHRAPGTRNFGFQQTSTTQTTSAPTTQETESYQRPKFYHTLRPAFQRTPYTGFQRTKEQGNSFSTTEQISEIQEKRDGPLRPKYGKSPFGNKENDKFEESKRTNEHLSEQQLKNKNLHTLEVRKYLRTKNREGAFSQFSKNRFYTSEKTETVATTSDESDEKESEEVTTPNEKTVEVKNEKSESSYVEGKQPTTQSLIASTDYTEEKTERIQESHPTTEAVESSEEESTEYEDTEDSSTAAEITTEGKTEVPTTPFRSVNYEIKVESKNEGQNVLETKTEETTVEIKTERPVVTEFRTENEITTEKFESQNTETQPDLYRFSKSSFSFEEAEKFAGTKNRAHVRNITADIIENTASFSAPGVEKHVVPSTSEGELPRTTEFHVEVTSNEKTEESTTEYNTVEPATEYPEGQETETSVATEVVTKVKPAKLIKTSTTTKISHETEICYKGKCIRTKSENPDDDLKLLVDSANIMKIEKPKT